MATYEHRGTYLVVDPPRTLAFTRISAGTEWQPSHGDYGIREVAGGTELTLTHERRPGAAQARRHEGGWSQIMDRLAAHLAHSTRSSTPG